MTHPTVIGRSTAVVIADRRDFDRLALEVLCQHSQEVDIAASVTSVAEAVRAISGISKPVVLIGRQLLVADGPQSIDRLRAAGAKRIIVVGTGEDDLLRPEAVRVGADGALRRDGDATSQLGVLVGRSGTVPRWVDNAAADHDPAG